MRHNFIRCRRCNRVWVVTRCSSTGVGSMADVLLGRTDGIEGFERHSCSSESSPSTQGISASSGCFSTRRASQRTFTTSTSCRCTISVNRTATTSLQWSICTARTCGRCCRRHRRCASTCRWAARWRSCRRRQRACTMHTSAAAPTSGRWASCIAISRRRTSSSLRRLDQGRRLRHRQGIGASGDAIVEPQGQDLVHVAGAVQGRRGRSPAATCTRSASCSTSSPPPRGCSRARVTIWSWTRSSTVGSRCRRSAARAAQRAVGDHHARDRADPERRYFTADELRVALDQFASKAGLTTSTSSIAL